MMLATGRLSVILLALAFAACGTRPTTEIDAAKRHSAARLRVRQYAPESLKAARDADAALDAELAAQDARWIKSYDRANELATSARLASEKAITDAAAGRRAPTLRGGRGRGRQGEGRHGRAWEAATRAVRVGGAIRNPTKTKNMRRVSRGGEVGPRRRHGACRGHHRSGR